MFTHFKTNLLKCIGYQVHSTKQISRELLIKAKTRQCLRQYCKKRGIDAVLYKRQQVYILSKTGEVEF